MASATTRAWSSTAAVAPVRSRIAEPAHHRVERRPRWTRAQGTEELVRSPLPVRELVAWIEAPCCNHRQHEVPALGEQVAVSVRISVADRVGHMGEIEFDGPTARRLEVDEPQPFVRAEH